MDLTTVIVRFTGLILFSAGPPSEGPGAHPSAYALFPVTPSPATHFAQIGFRQDQDIGCDEFSTKTQICYYNIDDLSIELGGHGNAKPNGALPPGNVTHALGGQHRIARGHFRRNAPVPASLFARVILHEGQQDKTCGIATYAYGTETEVPIANVVQWSYTYAGNHHLRVRGEPLRTGIPPREWTAPRDDRDTVEIFVRYLTRDDITHENSPVELPKTRTPLTHYRHLYTLLDPQPPANAVVPVFDPQLHRAGVGFCPWASQMEFRNGIPKSRLPRGEDWSAGTLTCTVGKGDPAGP